MDKIYYAEALKSLLPAQHKSNCKMVGRIGYIPMGDTVMKLEFHQQSASALDGYTGLQLSVINKACGVIDTVVLPFPEYVNTNNYTVPKRLCVAGNSTTQVYWMAEWTALEKELIQRHVQQYISLWHPDE
jgi:hypothetical protein